MTPGDKGMAGAIARVEELAAADPSRVFVPQQFQNPANPTIHERTTGPEIWRDTDGQVDAFVAGIGTGGTITGVCRYLKCQMGRPLVAVGVEPEGSPVLTQTRAGQPIKPGPHMIQGIGAGFVPAVLDLSLLDRLELIGNDEALEFAQRLARDEGILAGISSGAAVAAAARLAREPAFEGRTIVTILPDSAERYLRTVSSGRASRPWRAVFSSSKPRIEDDDEGEDLGPEFPVDNPIPSGASFAHRDVRGVAGRGRIWSLRNRVDSSRRTRGRSSRACRFVSVRRGGDREGPGPSGTSTAPTAGIRRPWPPTPANPPCPARLPSRPGVRLPPGAAE
jgi:hypothetical protein